MDHSKVGLALLTLDFASAVLPVLSQSPVRAGPPVVLLGCARSGSVFSLPVLENVHLGPTLSLRSPPCPGLVVPVSDSVHTGPATPLRSSVRLYLAMLISGCVRLGAPSPMLNSVTIGSTCLFRSTGQLGASLPTMDSFQLGTSLPARRSSHLKPASLAYGIVWAGSPLSMPDELLVSLLLPSKSYARLGLFLVLLDYVHLNASIFSRSLAHPGPQAALLGLARLGFIFSLPALDNAHSGLLSPARSLAHSSFSMFPLDFFSPGAPTSLRQYARTGSSFLASGRPTGNVLPLLDCLVVGTSLLARSFARIGLQVPVFGLSYFGSVSPLSASESVHPGALLPPRSSHHPGISLAASNLLQLEFVLTLHVFSRIGMPSIILGVAQLRLRLLAPDGIYPGLPLPFKGIPRIELPLVASDPLHSDVILPLRFSACTEAFSSVSSLFRIDPLLLTLDYAHPGVILALRSSSQLDLPLPMLNFLHSGMLLSLRSPSWFSLSSMVSGISHLGATAVVSKYVHPRVATSLRSMT